MYTKKIIFFILFLSYLNVAYSFTNVKEINQQMPNFTKEEKQWLDANPNINIATMLNAKYDENGNNIHTDLLKLLNKYGGTNFIAIKFALWKEAFNQARDGNLAFGILNLSWTKERSEKYFDYSESYNFDPLYLIVKEADTSIESLDDLENKTIYTQKDSSANKTVEHFTKNVNVLHYYNVEIMYKDLAKNEDIVAFVSYQKHNQYLEKHKLKVVKIIYNKYGHKHFGINKNYPQLYSIVNKIFKNIPKEKLSNLRDRVYETHKVKKIDDNKKYVQLTIEEKEWISENIVNIGVEDWSPIVSMGTSLKIDGISGDFIKLIVNRTGLQVKYISENWDIMLEAFKNHQIDILPATYYTDSRSKYGIFSDGYFKVKDYLYVKKNNNTILSMEDLEGKKLVLTSGFGSINKIKKKFPKIEIVISKSLHESINFVLNGKADALFDGQIVVEKKINDEFLLGLKGISQVSFDSPSLHVFSDINKPILASIIHKALNSISIQKKVEISNKWLQTINNDINTNIKINLNSNDKIDNQDLFLGTLSVAELLFAIFMLSILLIIIYTNYSKSRILNISMHKFILLIVSFELSVIFFLIYEIISLDRLENKLALVYKNKNDMVQVMQKLRQSSDDLTKSVRIYAITKDDKFKQQYFDILDIRNGIKPRPKNYSLIYWDLSIERRKQKHENLEKKSLKSIIDNLPFTSFQKNLLKLSEFNSNDLVHIEQDAMKATENNNQELAIKLLFSKQYHKEKERIMIPLDNMVISMYDQMNNQALFLNKKIRNEFIYIIIVGIFFILGNFIIYLMIIKKITLPLSYLSKVIEKFKKYEKDIVQKSFYQDEIGETIQQFFSMKSSIEEQQKDLEETHKHTRDSIEYSSLIQRSIIPEKELFAKYFKEYFVIWKPKDIIGGDIYLFNEINENECVFMIIDCTGHGVPGAFVTMLVKALEREIFSNIKNDKKSINTADILTKFNKDMKSILKQENSNSISNAGFDGGIIYYNKKEQIIKFSGANTALFIMKDNNLDMIKGNRHSIGYRNSNPNYKFTEHVISTQDNMKFYITTDGYLDQNGGEKGFPFGTRRFKDTITKHYSEELDEQENMFLNTLSEYQDKEETNDDITLIAFKI